MHTPFVAGTVYATTCDSVVYTLAHRFIVNALCDVLTFVPCASVSVCVCACVFSFTSMAIEAHHIEANTNRGR